jgi:hypothetical protein
MGVSFDKVDGVIWYDGKLVPWADANVHVLTHGLHYASAVLEGERAYRGTVFKSREHSERLKNSANILDFEIPWSVAEIDAAKQLVIDKNNLPDSYVRPIAWRGSEMMGVSAQTNTIHLAIAAWNWPSYFNPAEKLRGIRIALADYRRPDPATIPALAKATGLYMICTISKHKAEREGYAEAMMLEAGPRRRMHQRQHLLHQGRQDPHSRSRLLPRRHHPRYGDRSGKTPGHRGDRAPDHAGGAFGIQRMFHHRHRRRGDAGVGDREMEVHARQDLRTADGRLHRRSAAEGQEGGGVGSGTLFSAPSPRSSWGERLG